jgi:hypothetical protein
VCLITCNYINLAFGLFKGYSLILFVHSFFVIHYWSWSRHGKRIMGGKEALLVGCK